MLWLRFKERFKVMGEVKFSRNAKGKSKGNRKTIVRFSRTMSDNMVPTNNKFIINLSVSTPKHIAIL